MLHLFVPQSVTPLIWAYLVFSVHMPFAPFWPSAFIQSAHPPRPSRRLVRPSAIRSLYRAITHTCIKCALLPKQFDVLTRSPKLLCCSCTASFFTKCSKTCENICMHTYTHTTLTEWTLAAGSAEGKRQIHTPEKRREKF